MNVIKQVGPALSSPEEASDTLAGALAVPGVLFGFVTKENRVVLFATDYHPNVSLMPGQERITLAFPQAKTSEDNKSIFHDIADAMMGKGPFARPSR